MRWELPTGKKQYRTVVSVLLIQAGLGVAKPAGLLVSQDFFAELRLPYSVKRGESFPLNVTIFNYIDVSWMGTLKYLHLLNMILESFV